MSHRGRPLTVQRTRARMRGADGEGSNRDKECGERRCGPRSSPTHRGSATGHNKAFSVATSRTGGLGVASSCRTRARNRARLRGSRLAYRRHDLAALRCNPGDGCCLSRARRDLVALVPTEEQVIAQRFAGDGSLAATTRSPLEYCSGHPRDDAETRARRAEPCCATSSGPNDAKKPVAGGIDLQLKPGPERSRSATASAACSPLRSPSSCRTRRRD